MRIEPTSVFTEWSPNAASAPATAAFAARVEAGFDFRSAEYARLFEGSGATAFQHPLWLELLYERIAPRVGAEPLPVAVRDEASGRLAAVLPLVRRKHGLLKVVSFADLGITDYAGPVCGRAEWDALMACPRVRDAVLRAIKPFDLLRIVKVREDAPDLRLAFRSASCSVMRTAAHAARLDRPFPEWRAERVNPSLRKELDQKRRRLSRKGEVRFEALLDPARIETALSRMLEFRRARFESRAEKDALAEPAVFGFYREVAVAGAASGFARTYAFSLDGVPVAVVFGIAHRGRFLVLLSAFDNALRKSSVGYLLFEDIVADCIGRGDDVFDLTIGNEGYKQDLGAEATRLLEIRASGSPLGAVADLCLRQDWVKSFVKRRLAG